MASNPFFNEKTLEKNIGSMDTANSEQMTVAGAVNKSFILLTILLVTASYSWIYPSPILMIGGMIGGLVCAVWASFQPQKSSWLAPAYAAFEGLFVGSISAMYALKFNGIVFNAITLTLAILFTLLMAYKYQWIKVTEKFRAGVVAATGAICIVYLISFALSFFNIQVPYLHSGGMIGIGISLAIIGVAAMNLLLDFDNFDKGEQLGAPKYMEWNAAMGLLITLVWLYLEILRLLSKLNSRN